jgi:hypothetical protein
MRAMRVLDPDHYTPFGGLCIFTATLMNLYAVRFPAMSRPSSSSILRGEEPETLLGENLEDLRRFGELWEMGRGLLDVVGVMQKLYDRVVGDEVRRISHSRESYAVLEKTINLAQDHEIQVAELAAEASPVDDDCHGELRDVGNGSHDGTVQSRRRPEEWISSLFQSDVGGISDLQPMSPRSFSAVIDEDLWRDFVFFQDM